MATIVLCDFCARRPALDLSKSLPIATKEGRRVLLNVRVKIDNGEKEATRADVCPSCLNGVFEDFGRFLESAQRGANVMNAQPKVDGATSDRSSEPRTKPTKRTPKKQVH